MKDTFPTWFSFCGLIYCRETARYSLFRQSIKLDCVILGFLGGLTWLISMRFSLGIGVWTNSSLENQLLYFICLCYRTFANVRCVKLAPHFWKLNLWKSASWTFFDGILPRQPNPLLMAFGLMTDSRWIRMFSWNWRSFLFRVSTCSSLQNEAP